MQDSLFESCRINYIYSFAFDRLPLSERNVDAQNPDTTFGIFIKEKLCKSSNYERVELHESEEKEPVESRAALYAYYHHLSISASEETVEIKGIGEAEKGIHIALFESGMGVLWIRLTFGAGQLDLQNIIRFSSRQSLPLIKPITSVSTKDQEYQYPYEVFFSAVQTLNSELNQGILQLPPEVQQELCKKYPSLPSSNNSEYKKRNEQNRRGVFRIKWVDDEGGLLWRDKSDTEGRKDAYEEPNYVILLKVPVLIRDAIDLPIDANKRIEAEIMIYNILFFMEDSNLDLTHIRQRLGRDLISLYADKRFRTFLQSDRILILHSEENDSNELERFRMGLFRMFCSLRGIWHVHLIVNEHLDQTISPLISKVATADSSYEHLLDIQREIIKTKGYFLSSISVQDPLIWGANLTPFGLLYCKVADILKIKELKTSVENKISEFDRCFEMVNSLQLRSRYFKTRIKKKMRFNFRWFFGISLLLSYVYFFHDFFKSVVPDSEARFVLAGLFVLAILGLVLPGTKSTKIRYKNSSSSR